MADTIQGARYSGGSQGVADARVITDLGDVLLLEPNKTPLCVLTLKLGKEKNPSKKIEWQEDELLTKWDTLTSDAATDTTEVVCGDATIHEPYDLIKVPRSGDVMRITTITATNSTLVFTRISGNNTLAASEPIVTIGSAFTEGSSKANQRSTNVATVTNRTQIFKWSYGLTETLKATKLQGGPDLAYQQRKAALELATQLEYNLLTGLRYAATESGAGTTLVRACGGLPQYISTNSVNVGGALTMTKVDEVARKAMRYGESKTRLLACGYYWIDGINRLARDDLETVPTDKAYGIDIKELMTGYGKLLILYHRLLEGATYAGSAWCLNMSAIKMAVLRDVQHTEHVETPGDDLQQNEYKCEVGWKVKQEKTHCYAYGTTS